MKTALILFFGLFSGTLFSQETLIKGGPLGEIRLPNLDLISLDTRDQIFASTTSGDVYLYDQKGKQLNLFSPPRQGRLDQVEASWTVNIFTFSADLQEYRILDRFLNPLAENSFLLNAIVLPKAATLGNNNVIWVWDESDLSLKSLDYLRNIILQTQPLALLLDSENLAVTEIREFKNRLFVNAPQSGIFIFDNQGNFLQKVNLQLNQRLCFYKENLLWIEEGRLKMYSLKSQAIFDLGILPSATIQSVQIGMGILVFQEGDLVSIYPLPAGLKELR
jgi:hypothetical protein